MERAITVLSDVKDLGELLDGSRIEQVRMSVSGVRMRLELKVTRAMVEAPRTPRRGLFGRTHIPWITGKLTLNGIRDVSVQQRTDEPPDQVPLLACEAVPGGYTMTITAPGGLRLQLALEQLDGQFVDVGSPVASP